MFPACFPLFFCALPNGKILLGQGQLQACFTPVSEIPCFYSPHFFLTKRKPWLTFSSYKELSVNEFIQEFKETIPHFSPHRWQFPNKEKFLLSTRNILEEIQKGTLAKAVPHIYAVSQREVEEKEVANILKRAAQKCSPEEHLIGFWKKGHAMAALTPEKLFSLKNNQLETVSLAGTISIDEPDEELYTEKNLLEQRIVTNSILQALSSFGSVTAKGPHIVQRGKLKHLQTRLFCSLEKDVPIETLVESLHPTPALGGCPKIKALSLLKQLCEGKTRTTFGAPFGVFFPKEKEAHIYVCIRSIEWKESLLRMGIGCGVVSGSSEEKEWAEVEKKLRNLQHLFGV